MRGAALAAWDAPVDVEELVDLGEAGVDPDHRRRPLGEQVVAEAAAAVHLDQQSAEVAQRILAGLQQRAAFPAQHPGRGPARGDSFGVVRPPAKECGHARRV